MFSSVNSELCREIAKIAEWSDNHNQCGYLSPPIETWTNEERLDWLKNGVIITPLMREGECGTKACLAGFTAIKQAPDGTSYRDGVLHFPDGTWRSIESWAGKELGLSYEQRQAIFFCFDNQSAIDRLYYVADHPDATFDQLKQIGQD